jgi:hypothetical protein
MKKIFTTIAMLTMFAMLFAKGPGTEIHKFAPTYRDVVLEVERGKGDVVLHVLVKDAGQYYSVTIEKSEDVLNNYSQCKYINIKTEKPTAEDYFLRNDKYPLPAQKDSYYRVITVDKEGITKVYPGVLLQGIKEVTTTN